jgi:acyl transferase domain-containing protein
MEYCCGFYFPPDISFLIHKWQFPLAPMAWPQPGPRRISVNSFGFGGTNAHAILDDSYHYFQEHGIFGHHRTYANEPNTPNVEMTISSTEPSSRLFVWSTSDETGIRRLFEAFREFLSSVDVSKVEDTYLDDLAYTLATKRTIFPYRSFVQAATLSELVNRLGADAGPLKPLRSKAGTNLGFVFTGQGAQWARMGVELLQYPIFKRSFDEADAYLKTLSSSWSLLGKSHNHATCSFAKKYRRNP